MFKFLGSKFPINDGQETSRYYQKELSMKEIIMRSCFMYAMDHVLFKVTFISETSFNVIDGDWTLLSGVESPDSKRELGQRDQR